VVELHHFGPAGIVTTTPRRYAESLLRYHGIDLPVLVAYRAAGMTSLLVAWHRSLPGACRDWHDVLARVRALA